MESITRREALGMIAAAAGMTVLGGPSIVRSDNVQDILGRIIALGIPGASAISPVGTFLPGGPVHDKPEFVPYTQPGQILDPKRILVGSRSNFGAPLANFDEHEGSFLSIDPRGTQTLVIPAGFAAAGGQASTLAGYVRLYSAQSPACLNSVNTPGAVTANFTGVSNPLGLSINNAFGRPWPANAPTGLDGIGTSTVLDPTGVPLAGAPNPQAGGVFAGNLTPRVPQVLPGALDTGAVGTAFLGKSPDGSDPRRAVFSVVLADGGIAQVHVLKGVDGLAPAGTVSPLLGQRWTAGEQDASPRLGVILNYSPTRVLYVSEPFTNTIAAIDLSDDGALNQPVDLAPAENETSDPNWSSNTTLEAGADFYVANHGDNTIVRMAQDGTVVGVRRVRLADGRSLGNGRLNGIAVSPDGNTVWVTVLGKLAGQGNIEGSVLELPAFEG